MRDGANRYCLEKPWSTSQTPSMTRVDPMVVGGCLVSCPSPSLLPQYTRVCWVGPSRSQPVLQNVSGHLFPCTPGVHRAGELVTWGSGRCWAQPGCISGPVRPLPRLPPHSCSGPWICTLPAPAAFPHSRSSPHARMLTFFPLSHTQRAPPPGQLLLIPGAYWGLLTPVGRGQLTIEAAHIQRHAGLLLGCSPLEPGRGEGAGSPRALLLGPAHGLHEAVLTHSLEAVPPIIRHEPDGSELEPG